MPEKHTYFHGTGRRKTAVAQVKLMAGAGEILINGEPYEERFTRPQYRQSIMAPLVVTNNVGKYHVEVKVDGGGDTGQSQAVAHGLARALLAADEKHKPALKQNGLLTRDSRAKERKKPGLKRARKAPQYTKR